MVTRQVNIFQGCQNYAEQGNYYLVLYIKLKLIENIKRKFGHLVASVSRDRRINYF